MLDWIINIITSIFSFILNLLGLDASFFSSEKKTVRFADQEEQPKEEIAETTSAPVEAQ
jgi:hypothetical protein